MSAVALQKAIYSRLSTGLTEPVYSAGAVPDGIMGLYVIIGEDTLVPHDSDQETGFDATVTIHCWQKDNARGLIPVKELAEKVSVLMHREDLAVEDVTILDCIEEFRQNRIDTDGLSAQVIVRYRVIGTNVVDLNAGHTVVFLT